MTGVKKYITSLESLVGGAGYERWSRETGLGRMCEFLHMPERSVIWDGDESTIAFLNTVYAIRVNLTARWTYLPLNPL